MERRQDDRANQKKEMAKDQTADSCFGPTEELSAQLQAFCDRMPSDQPPDYQKLISYICEAKQIGNLFRPECGWNGAGGEAEQKAHMDVVESTPLDDTLQDYYYLVAYSLTPPAKDLGMVDSLFQAHGDQDGFIAAGYELPKSTTITPDPDLPNERRQGGTRTLNYIMSIESNVGTTRFLAEMKAVAIDDDFTVVFDRAIGIFEGLKMRRNLTFALLLPDGKSSIVVLEERLVPDRGLHDIARSVLLKNDLVRMKLFYDNAVLDNNR